MDDFDSVYIEARRKGLRESARMAALGRPGNLPYLDEMLVESQVAGRETLGMSEIPLKKIIGTYSAGRSVSFAANFMPLLDPTTEFALKWKYVYRHQMNEGITDAVKAFEYLNRYYIVEGNKRVSVLKHVDAASVLAEVTRLVPKYDESNEVIRHYYEFLEFWKKTKINDIWVTKPGYFRTLLRLMRSVAVPEAEKANPYQWFVNTYYKPFRDVLYELGGDRLPMTTGDVFLKYFDLYKLHKRMSEKDFRPRLQALCDELRHSLGFEDEGLVTAPEEPPEPSLLSSIFGLGKPKQRMNIAFAYSGSMEESNWAKAHENGRLYVQQALEDEIQTTYVDNVAEDIGAYGVFKKLIEDGYSTIFATSPAFGNAALRTALEFPQAHIYLCSEQPPSRLVNTYFGRIYEPRFLTGIIAGALTRTDRIGYIGSYPVRGVISGVNAFALGARLINPRARIHVSWAYQWDFKKVNEDLSQMLGEAGADIISHQNTFTGVGYEGEYGLYSLTCEHGCRPDEYIATPVWNWGVFYEKMIRQILFAARSPADRQPTQFWWGMDAGIVDVMYAKKYVPLETHKLVLMFKEMLKEGTYNVFNGPIFDQAGTEKIAPGETGEARQIISMDWFVNGIEGNIPEVSKGGVEAELTAEMLEI